MQVTRKALLKEMTVEESLNIQNNLQNRKREKKINSFQIENLKIKSIFYYKNNEKIEIKKEEKLSEIDEKLIYENHTIDFYVEIEMIQFGKKTF